MGHGVGRMSFVKRKIAAVLVCSLGVACTSYKPPSITPVPQVHVINTDVESAWKAVIRCVSEFNMPIDHMDHGSYFLKTRPVMLGRRVDGVNFNGRPLDLNNEYCDCGEASIGNVWSTESQIQGTYSVVLISLPEGKTEVRLNAFFDGVYLGKRSLAGPGYDIAIDLKCVSKGEVERKLFEFIKLNAGLNQ